MKTRNVTNHLLLVFLACTAIARNLTAGTLTATVSGNPSPGIFYSLPITNGDFTISTFPEVLPIGDAWNEWTTWTFDFTTNAGYASIATGRITSAILTLTLTTASRWDGAPCPCPTMTDDMQVLPLPPIITPIIQTLPPSYTTNLQLNLLSFYSPSNLMWAITNAQGRVPMYYEDDALLFFARLDLELDVAPVLAIRVSEVEVSWESVSNETYQIQSSSALTPGTWTPLQCVLGDGGTKRVYDKVLLGEPRKFYRLQITNCVPQP